MSKNLKKIIGLTAVLLLAGCSSGSSLLDTKSAVPQASAVQVGNNLVLPPDLQLAAPGRTVNGYQPNGYVAPIAIPSGRLVNQVIAFGDPLSGKSDAVQQQAAYLATENVYSNQGIGLALPGDYYAKYGISRFRANGKLKTPAELKRQLNATVLAKKRSTNPNYGTIGNVANVLSGGDDIIMRP